MHVYTYCLRGKIIARDARFISLAPWQSGSTTILAHCQGFCLISLFHITDFRMFLAGRSGNMRLTPACNMIDKTTIGDSARKVAMNGSKVSFHRGVISDGLKTQGSVLFFLIPRNDVPTCPTETIWYFFFKWPGPLQQLLVSREFFLFSKSFQSHTSVFYFLGRNIPHPAISEQQWSGALELRIDGKRLLMAEPLGGFIGWDAN